MLDPMQDSGQRLDPPDRAERERLRLTFGADAELYDRVRPGYPAQLFDDLDDLACIGRGCRVLEIGPGTGQATIPLAHRGCRLVGVELSSGLAEVAQRKTAELTDVDIVNAAFEEWPLPVEPFDTVVSATAFHWIDPAVRVLKAADALRPEGVLATIGTHHVAGGSVAFFADVQRCYLRWDPATTSAVRLLAATEIAFETEELDRSRSFGPAVFRRYEWNAGYSTEDYRNLLLTYSGHRAMEPTIRDSLLDCISELIESRHGGQITKRYLTELRVAHRR